MSFFFKVNDFYSQVHYNAPFLILFHEHSGSSPKLGLSSSAASVAFLVCLYSSASPFFWSAQVKHQNKVSSPFAFNLVCGDTILRCLIALYSKTMLLPQKTKQIKRTQENFRFRFYDQIIYWSIAVSLTKKCKILGSRIILSINQTLFFCLRLIKSLLIHW